MASPQESKGKQIVISFTDLKPDIQEQISKDCGYPSTYKLTQAMFNAKYCLSWRIEFPINDEELDKLADAVSGINIKSKTKSSKKMSKITDVVPPKKKSKVGSYAVNMDNDENDESSSVDLCDDTDEEIEYDEMYPNGVFFSYGSQILWLNFSENNVEDIINPSSCKNIVTHSYMRDIDDIQAKLVIGCTSSIPNLVKLSGRVKAEYMDSSNKMLVLTIPPQLTNSKEFDFMMNILAKAFAHDVPKKRKVFFGKMENEGTSGRWGMPNSDKMLHMLEKFGITLV